MTEAAGVEIPKGSPEELHTAARAWKALGSALQAHVQRLGSAADVVVDADWHGPASIAYSGSSRCLTTFLTIGVAACRDAATACDELSRALRDAQHRARAARRRAEQAISRRDAARRKAQTARDRIAAASTAAEDAAHRAATAAAAGPAGTSALANAHADGHNAARAGEAAGTALRDAERAIEDAEHDLRVARKHGEDANEDAERAGRDAARSLADVRSEAQLMIPISGPVEVPVSLRDADPDMPGLDLGFGGPFHAPGRFGSPGDARAAQIAKERRSAIDAAEAAKDDKGSIFDGVSGLVHSASVGAIDLGGDKDSDRYRGGHLAGDLPLTPGGAFKSASALAAKLAIKKEAKQEVAKVAKPFTPVVSDPKLRPPRLPEHPEVDLPPPPKVDLGPLPVVKARLDPQTGKWELRPARPPEPTTTEAGSALDDLHKAEHLKRDDEKRGAKRMEAARNFLAYIEHQNRSSHHDGPVG